MVHATQELVEQHLPLVEHVVMRISAGFPRHVDRGELVSAGILGLVEAASRFDESRGIPFSSFASARIRGSVLDFVRSNDSVPRSVRAATRGAEAREQELASQLGRTPTSQELAGGLDMTVEELEGLRDRVHRGVVLALDRVYGTGEKDGPLVSNIVDPSAPDPLQVIESVEMQAYLHDAVKMLPTRHRIVIVGYFLEGRTSEEIADELDITQSRVSQLRADALEMLRNGLESQFRPRPTERPVGRVARRQASYATAVATASTFKARLGVSPWMTDEPPNEGDGRIA